MSKKLDLVGQKFNRLEVEIFSHSSSKGDSYWVCKCSCGNRTRPIRGTKLVRGDTKSCGCLLKEKAAENHSENIMNKLFGYLTAVIPTDKRDGGSVVWLCSCQCGGTKEVSVSRLMSKHVTSCGCLARKKLELIGQYFGELVVVSFSHFGDKRQSFWICQCRCGKITPPIIGHNLTRGNTRSCGCKKFSFFQKEVKQTLQYIGAFILEEEYRLEDESLNYPLWCDFFISYKDTVCVVEANGMQHYQVVNFWGGVDGLEKTCKRDHNKRRILFQRRIPLIEVRYDEKDIQGFLQKELERITIK